MLIRRASSGGLFSSTPFDLRRETAILDRIDQFGLSVPAVHAVTTAGDMMLMQFLPGGSGYGATPPAQHTGAPHDTGRVNYFILLNLVRSALAGWSHH